MSDRTMASTGIGVLTREISWPAGLPEAMVGAHPPQWPQVIAQLLSRSSFEFQFERRRDAAHDLAIKPGVE